LKIIGLTGGIGSGKSTFCKLMRAQGIETIDTDEISRLVVEPGSIGLDKIVAEFGKSVLNSDGSLDRAHLRKIVFEDSQDTSLRQKLEAILHPLIKANTREQISAYQKNTNYRQPYLLVAIPLLIEGILKTGKKPSYIDEIWVLDCSTESQIERASQRDQLNVEQIKKILAHQVSREQRLQFADHVIENEGDLDSLKLKVNQLLHKN
jgi:dephospho-CoA kinase